MIYCRHRRDNVDRGVTGTCPPPGAHFSKSWILDRLRISNGTEDIIDSGRIIDKAYKGGRVGVMVFSQEKVIWSNVVWECNNGKILRCINERKTRINLQTH